MSTPTEAKIEALTSAITEAERFIKAAGAAIKRLRTDNLAYMVGSKETATVKRASMDLSRALTKVRGQ